MLRWRLEKRLQTLKADDIVIDSEGIGNLTFKELEEVLIFFSLGLGFHIFWPRNLTCSPSFRLHGCD
jgi:hypothetical protein